MPGLPFLREILGAVEGHVLQEVGKSALAWLFENGTYALCYIEVGESGFLGVVADIVGESVFQCALAHGRVLWQLCPSAAQWREECEAGDQ